ncbi:PEP-CTERM sorting domain-containing protein [Tunturiibacter psychrotolerans]|uniref:PEP-CTERM sorting domain-containing protein n=1 Tax=Tunturiibacter psychrotolerans TaxID=3069686 RepID=UPI003D24CB45
MRLRFALFLSLLALPLPMLADTVYTYKGYNFNELYGDSGDLTTKDHVSGTVTFTQPLGDNSTVVVTPIAFSFSDGVSTITNLTAVPGLYLNVSLETNSLGEVAYWEIFMQNEVSPDPGYAYIYTENSGEGALDPAVDGGALEGGGAYTYHAPGKWTESSVSTVPEPSAVMLLGTGMLGLVGMVRRKPSANC